MQATPFMRAIARQAKPKVILSRTRAGTLLPTHIVTQHGIIPINPTMLPTHLPMMKHFDDGGFTGDPSSILDNTANVIGQMPQDIQAAQTIDPTAAAGIMQPSDPSSLPIGGQMAGQMSGLGGILAGDQSNLPIQGVDHSLGALKNVPGKFAGMTGKQWLGGALGALAGYFGGDISSPGVGNQTNPYAVPNINSTFNPASGTVTQHTVGSHPAPGSHHAAGGIIQGPGDGKSDSVMMAGGSAGPSALSDGEYVLTAPEVAAIGNGSSHAGARVLDAAREALAHKKYRKGREPATIAPHRNPLVKGILG